VLTALGHRCASLTLKQAVDQVAAMLCAEILEELTGHRSGWSPEEYERWLSERL
jgi:hypothetical protein